MRTTRPDLPAYALSGLAVLGIVVLSLFHIALPDVLPLLAASGLVGGAGISLNTPSATDGTAARIEAALGSLQALIGDVRRPTAAAAAPAPRPAPVQGFAGQAAPAPAGVTR